MTAPAVVSKMAKAAVRYAQQGWVLIPLHTALGGKCSCHNPTCPSPAKHPRTAHGLLEATSDVATVTSWWHRWPDANIGCKPGPSGFVVLDLDGPEGEASAEAAGVLSEPTLEVITGRGRHRWYRHPGGHIPNGTLGAKLDIRGDAGYVLLPPSGHVSGAVYRWAGRLDDVATLPAAIVARIQGTPDGAPAPGPRPDQLPAWMIPWLEVKPGERNQTMARFVGWAYAQSHDDPTVLAMARGVSAAWPSPLDPREVEAVVKSIGVREARKPRRTTTTGTVLRVAEDPAPEAPPESLNALAYRQIEQAIEQGQVDYSGAPRWCWGALNQLVGPMLPGDLVVVGGLTGNGKTAFTMSQVAHWTSVGTTVLYVPLELDPERVRRHWAAWATGLEWVHVARNDWAQLPAGSRDRHEAALVEQASNPHIHLPPDRRISLTELASWTARAVEEVGAQVVVIDHFHRMDVGGANANYRVQVTEVARSLKDMARTHRLPVLALAQLNQDPHPLDRYFPPHLKRLKESAGLGEEADLVLMLSRRLTQEVSNELLAQIRSGHADVRDYEASNVMMVTCRKSRLVDEPRDRSVQLSLDGGRVVDLVSSWAIPSPRWIPRTDG